jgi:outer membrane receptor for ferrienterochelin and colicin
MSCRCAAAGAACALAWCVGPVAARAADVGSVRGVIADSRHEPVAGARVTLKSGSSEWVKTARTGSHGEFSFLTVPIGDYVITADKAGSSAAEGITVVSGASPTARLELVPASGLADVTVIAPAEKLSLDTATPTTLVSREDIERTPGADRSNSLAMITNFVPGAYVVHDQLHVRGGHQTTWAVDGVEIPNTNIASNLGPAIDPKDIDYLEVLRGSYQPDQGDRTYGVFNIVPRTGWERTDEGELVVSGGSFGQTNDYMSIASHTDDLAYYLSVNGNRSGLGIETPVAQIVHDAEDGYGGFGSLIYDATPDDQLRFVFSARHDDYDIPNDPADPLDDAQRETDSFGILSWVHTVDSDTVLTTSVFAHSNAANLDAAPDDYPISTTDRRSSTYVGGQEVLRFDLARNDVRIGALGFSQHDTETFVVLFNDGSSLPIHEQSSPAGTLEAAYVEDTFKASDRLTLMGGVRQTHFSGPLVENATSPRLGATFVLPALGWTVRGFWGRYYQAPPLQTLSGPLLEYAQASNLGFLPLHGERDEEYQAGLTIPWSGWSIDMDHFHTEAKNFFDHNPIGNSNVFLPLTIDGALIQGNELSIRSPRFWDVARAYVTYSNQTADGRGAINGGLTDFSPPAGSFALDHDQRNTANVGFDATLPCTSFVSMNVYYGSGFANGEGTPSHLPGHAEIDMSAGKSFGKAVTASITVLNLTDRHLLTDNSLTFGGFHYNDPRQIVAELRYRFGY